MVGLSRLAGGGLLPLVVLALLPLALDGKPTAPPQPLLKAPVAPSRPSPIMRLLRPEQPIEGGSDGGSSPLKGTAKLGNGGCFGTRLDHIGTSSGLGCGGVPKPKLGGS